MKIKLENVNLNSTSGPNYFSSKLAKYLNKMGKSCFTGTGTPDVTLCFTETRGPKISPLVQRLDGIWFNSATNYNAMNSNYKKIYEISDGVIYQSQFDKKLIEYHFGKHQNSTIINNGADIDLISQVQPYDSSLVGDAENVWCCASHFAGRHHKRLNENIRYFLEHSNSRDVMLIAGKIDCNNFAHSNVHYIGELGITDLMSVYKRSKYFVHLARLDHCPNVVVDARAAGCKIICSNLGGTVEVAGTDAIVIEEDEWDFKPFNYNQPSTLDFSRKIKNKFDCNVDMNVVARRYYEFLESNIKNEN